MSGLLIESENDSDENTVSSKESIASRNKFGPKLTQVGNTHLYDGAHEVYKVQEKLENYTRRLSQLGLGLDSEGSSEISRPSSSIALSPTQHSHTLNSGEVSHQPSIHPKSPNKSKTHSPTPRLRRSVSSKSPQSTKIQIKFQPIGSIPQLRPNTCKISSHKPFSTINVFLKKRLKVENVFCYINNSFAPSPNERIGDLWAQFKVNDELIISYCAIVAFG